MHGKFQSHRTAVPSGRIEDVVVADVGVHERVAADHLAVAARERRGLLEVGQGGPWVRRWSQ